MRLLSTAIVLTTLALLGHESATAALPQATQGSTSKAAWTPDQPLTGRAIPCDSNGNIETFSCNNVELLSYLPAPMLGGATGNDVWGWHDSTTGREFAIIGSEAGTAFVEVTDPVNPKYLGILLPTSGSPASAAQGVKVYKNYAFIGYEGTDNGLQILDLTQLRTVKEPVTFTETAHYSEITSTHTIALNQESGFAYANGTQTCGGGLHIIDVHDPTKPTFVNCFTEPATGGLNGNGYVHDTQCVIYRGPDKQYQGREICLNSSGGALGIADVTDKTQGKTISIARYPNLGYTHQGWLTADQRYFFVDDELDENASEQQWGIDSSLTRTIVFDLTDLDDPVVLTEYYATTHSTDHNLYINGRYMYQGNYGAGLRIVDIADPKHPKEVGYFTDIGMAWGTYPFFKNDVVAVSASSGLYLARLLKR